MESLKNRQTDNSVLNKEDLVFELKNLGIKSGMNLFVDFLDFSFERIIGGRNGIIDALYQCVGSEGTLLFVDIDKDNVEPLLSQTEYNETDCDKIRANTYNYYHNETYSYLKSKYNDNVSFFRHSYYNFVALGKFACLLTNSQVIDYPLGTNSPLGRLFEIHGSVLMVGRNLQTSCTTKFLLNKLKPLSTIINGGHFEVDGVYTWKQFFDYHYPELEENALLEYVFNRENSLKRGIGEVNCLLFPFYQLVEDVKKSFNYK